MNDLSIHGDGGGGDLAPGQHDASAQDLVASFRGYLIGLVLAVALTVASFAGAKTQLIYEPGIVPALVTLAIAQIGVHLIFFLHITTAPDNTNNVLALAFGVLIVGFVLFGSLWIMAHLNHMMPAHALMNMRR